MTNDTPQRDALLAEYQACQQEANASGGFIWYSASVLFAAALAGLFLLPFPSEETRWAEPMFLTLLTLGVWIGLWAWWIMTDRHAFIRNLMFMRQGQIEQRLPGVLKSTAVSAVDSLRLPQGASQELTNLFNSFSRRPHRPALPWLRGVAVGIAILWLFRLGLEWLAFLRVIP